MTISVANNANGSFTVTCGAESVTVTPSPAKTETDGSTWPKVDGGNGGNGWGHGAGVMASAMKWPIITAGGGGVTADLIAAMSGAAQIEEKHVASQSEMDAHLAGLISDKIHMKYFFGDPKPALRIVLTGPNSFELGPFAKAWSDSLKDRYSLCEIHLSDAEQPL